MIYCGVSFSFIIMDLLVVDQIFRVNIIVNRSMPKGCCVSLFRQPYCSIGIRHEGTITNYKMKATLLVEDCVCWWTSEQLPTGRPPCCSPVWEAGLPPARLRLSRNRTSHRLARAYPCRTRPELHLGRDPGRDKAKGGCYWLPHSK